MASPAAEIEVVESSEARLSFEAKRCIHSRTCVLSRPDVFVPNVVGPWLHPERATAAEMVELAHNCPSGAIRVEYLDGRTSETAPLVNTLQIRENGPYAIRAAVEIFDHGAMTRATLCRCGASKNKPYCDGSHAAASFKSTGEPETRADAPLPVRDGPVSVKPLPDGPLLVEGSLDIVTGTGRTIARVTRTALCRCGESKNKPYCDGSHVAAGFKA